MGQPNEEDQQDEQAPLPVPGSSAEDYVPSDTPEPSYDPASVEPTPPTPPRLSQAPGSAMSNLNQIADYGQRVQNFDARTAAANARKLAAQAKRDHNAAARKDSADTGAQYQTDENGVAQPLVNPDTGQQKFRSDAPIRYGPDGKPYRYTEGRQVEDPDKNASYGENPDDPTDPYIYRKNAAQPWQPIDPEEGIHSADGNLAAASAKALHKREIKSAIQQRRDLGLGIQQLRASLGPDQADTSTTTETADDTGEGLIPHTIPTGGLTPKARQLHESIIAANSQPIPKPSPKPGIFGIGVNQQATADAETQWAADEQARQNALAASQKLLATDDQIKTGRDQMFALSMKVNDLRKEGPMGMLKRRRDERAQQLADQANSQAAATSQVPGAQDQPTSDDPQQNAILHPQGPVTALDVKSQEIANDDAKLGMDQQSLQSRWDAWKGKRSLGMTAAELDQSDAEGAALQREQDQLQEGISQRNAKASELQGAADIINRQRQDEIKASRDKLRADPTTAPLANKLDAIDADFTQRQQAIASEPDPAKRQIAMDALAADRKSKIDAATQEHQQNFYDRQKRIDEMGQILTDSKGNLDDYLGDVAKISGGDPKEQDQLIREASTQNKLQKGQIDAGIVNGRIVVRPEASTDTKKITAAINSVEGATDAQKQDAIAAIPAYQTAYKKQTFITAQAQKNPGDLAVVLTNAQRDGEFQFSDEEIQNAKKLDSDFKEIQRLAGESPALKAFLASALKSGASMELGTALSAAVGELTDPELAAIGAGPGVAMKNPVVAAIGAGALPALTHVATFLIGQKLGDHFLNALQSKLSEYNDTVKSFTKSEELDRMQGGYASKLGGLAGMGPRAAQSIYNLKELAVTKAAEVTKKALENQVPLAEATAMGRNAGLGVLGSRALAGAGAAIPFELVGRPAVDFACNTAADVLGIKHEEFQPPTVQSVFETVAAGIILTGQGIKVKNYSTPEVAEIFRKASVATSRGIPLEKVLRASEIDVYNEVAPKLAGIMEKGGGKLEKDPDFNIAVKQVLLFPDRPVGNKALQRAYAEKESKWTPEEKNVVQSVRGGTPIEEIAKTLGKKPEEIEQIWNQATTLPGVTGAMTSDISGLHPGGEGKGGSPVTGIPDMPGGGEKPANATPVQPTGPSVEHLQSQLAKVEEAKNRPGIDPARLAALEHHSEELGKRIAAAGGTNPHIPPPEAVAVVGNQIAAWKPSQDSKEDPVVERNAASASAKLLAAGPNASLDTLTAAERAAIDQKLPGKEPRYEMVNGVPVVTNGQLSRLQAIAPDAPRIILGRTEESQRGRANRIPLRPKFQKGGVENGEVQTHAQEGQRRQEVLTSQDVPAGQPGGTSKLSNENQTSPQQQGASTDQTGLDQAAGGNNRQKAENSSRKGGITKPEGDLSVSRGTSVELLPLPVGKFGDLVTEKEQDASSALQARLADSGVDATTAKAYSDYYVRREGTADWGPDKIDSAVDEFAKAGGHKNPEAIREAVRASNKSQEPEVEKIVNAFHSQLGDKYKELSANRREKLDNLIRHRIAPELVTYVGAVRKYLASMRKAGGGGVAMGSGLTFDLNVGDLFAGKQLEILSSDVTAERSVNEEVSHIANCIALAKIRADRTGETGSVFELALKEGREIFLDLPGEIQDYVRKIRGPELGENDGVLGLEFFRMLLQRDIVVEEGKFTTADGVVITEQTLAPGLLEKIRNAIRKMIAFFGEIKSEMARMLRAEKVPEDEIARRIARVEEARQESIKVMRGFKKAGDESRQAAYEQEYGVSKRNEGDPQGRTSNDRGGDSRGRGVEPLSSGNAPGNGPGIPVGSTATATSPETATRLATLEAEKEQRLAADERAKERRNLAVQQRAKADGNKDAILAKVPEEAKPLAEEVLSHVEMGNPSYVLGANRERIPASYIAAAPGTVQASHEGSDFHKNSLYGGENTRPYHSDETEQNKVLQIAKPGALDEDSIVTDAKSAADGPAQVVLAIFNDSTGALRVSLQTAGGNGREQGINLAPLEDQERLSQAWKERGAQFGLSNIPDGWRGYRFLGVYDLRDEARNREYQQLVDKLNPNQGVVQDTAARADIDAALNIPVERLLDVPVSLSPEEAKDVMVGLVRDSEKLGLDRNLVAGLVRNPSQAQFYIRRLLVAAAFRSKALGEFVNSTQKTAGHVTISNLVDSATSTALQLRSKGQGAIADAIGRTLERVVEYAKGGRKINLAIEQAAGQQEIGADGPVIQAIADALVKKVEFYPLNKKGIRNVDPDATSAGFDDLMADIARGVQRFSGESDLLGEAPTIAQTIQAAIDAHFRKNGLKSRGSKPFNRAARIRELQRKRQSESLTRWESQELTQLEKTSGQEFMDFFDKALDDRFQLESEFEKRGIAPAPEEQMQLMAIRGDDSPSRAAAQEILKKTDDVLPGGTYNEGDEGAETKARGAQGGEQAAARLPRPEKRDGSLAQDASRPPQAGPLRQLAEPRTLDARGRDPRLVRLFGEDWKWTELGLPKQPEGIKDPNHPLLQDTSGKSTAELRPESLAVTILGMKPGTVSRKALHEAIVDYFLSGGYDRKPLSEIAKPSKHEVPFVMFMGGGGASGKTSMLNNMIAEREFDRTGTVLVNTDEVREFIPEYDALNALGDGRSSRLTHPESVAIVNEIERRARQRQLSIIKDGTMRMADDGIKAMKSFQAEGYKVRMLAVTIDPHEALVRGYLRAKNSARYVPDNVLLEAHKGFNRALIAYIRFLGEDAITIYDNSPKYPIHVSGEDILSHKFQEVWDRQNLDPSATTIDELLASYGQSRIPDQLQARKSTADDLTGDLFAQAAPEIAAYNKALDEEGITHPQAKAAAVMADLGVSAPVATDLFGNPLTKPESARISKPEAPNENQPVTRREKTPPRRTQPAGTREPAEGGVLGDLFERVASQRQAELDSGLAPKAEGGTSSLSGYQGMESGPSGGTPEDRRSGRAPGTLPDVGNTGLDGPGDRSGKATDSTGRGKRKDSAPALVERPAPGTPERNFSFSRDAELAPRGTVSKLRANLEAISIIKTLDTEGRLATPEEKEKLAKFSGWGALSQAFDDDKADRVERGEIETRRQTAQRNRTDAEHYSGSSEYYRNQAEMQEFEATKLENWKNQWFEAHQQLKSLLTDQEYRTAKRSTINAHYTSPEIIGAMWDMAERMGFKGGNVLEPGAGIGHFFGLMPETIADRSKMFGVELDSYTAKILKALYPEADIQNTGFQTADIADNSIDLAVSNVPFANVPVVDKSLEAMGGPVENLHDYFFGKSLTKLKPGGIQIFITSAFTMDKGNPEIRKWLSERADLVAAYRLPNDAFKANAGTDVVTDIIVLRKKDGKHFPQTQDWTALGDTTTQKGEPIRVNQYFASHPQNILGLLDNDGSMFAGREGDKKEMTVHSDPSRPAKIALQQALADLPQDIIGADSVPSDARTHLTAVKMGNIVNRDGKYYFQGQDTPDPDLNDPKNAGRVVRFLDVRDALNRQYDLELSEDATEEEIEANRSELNSAYDRFKAQFANFHDRKNKALFIDDPDYFRLMGAEIEANRDKGAAASILELAKRAASKREYVKADIFTKRVLEPRSEPKTAGSVEDAFGISLGWRGRVDTGFISELTGQTPEQIERALIEREIAVRDPETGQILSREQYLSGNVRKKLEVAKASGPDYARNVALLEPVQPREVGIEEVRFKIGATWIPPQTYSDFLKSIGISGVNISYLTGKDGGGADRWEVDDKKSRRNGVAYKDFQTDDIGVLEIMDNLLNFRKITITGKDKDGKIYTNDAATAQARETAKKLNAKFIEWAKTNEDIGPELAKVYNREVNSYAQRTYDGQFLTFPWANKDFDIYPDKKNTIWRAIQEGYGLMAHGVGGGKTIIGSAIALEMRRLGMARKPMIVVHNATLEGFAKELAGMAPTARVLVGRKDELQGDKRREFLMRIAAGDWDAVVIAHSTFGMIEDDPQLEMDTMQNLVDEMMESLKESGFDSVQDAKDTRQKSPTVKNLVKQIERLEAGIAKASNRKVDEGLLNFQQLGVDALVVDEVHQFKKMPFSTKLEAKGIDGSFSKRGYALLMRARAIQAKMGGKNVFTMTGTPVTNTLGEIWNMIRLVAPNLLKDYNIEYFDQFVSKFAEVETVSEMGPTGDFKSVDRLSKVVNLPEWATLLRMAADVKLGDDLIVKNRPGIKGGKPELVAVQRSAGVSKWVDYVRSVLDEFSKLEGKELAENPRLTAIPVQAYMASRAAAIDIRLVEPRAKDEPDSKVNVMLDRLMGIYEKTTPYKGSQVIFADSFNQQKITLFDALIPNSNLDIDLDPEKEPDATFNLYEDIRSKLIARGVPADEIAVITDSKWSNDQRKQALFEMVNEGKVRIIIGSTQRLGTGVNMQKRMAAAHHLDVPWTPAELEQRDGRVFRQGNIHGEMGVDIELIRYGMKDTLDAALWQKLETKQRFITLSLSGKIVGRELEELDEIMTLAEQRAVLSGPYGQQMFELENRMKELETARLGFAREAQNRKAEISSAQNHLRVLDERTARIQPSIANMQKLSDAIKTDGVQIAVDGKTFETKADTAKAIDAALDASRGSFTLSADGNSKAPAVTSITVNVVPVYLSPDITFSEVSDDQGTKMVPKVAFNLLSSASDKDEALSFGRVTSSGTLSARLEELGESVESIKSSIENNSARLRQLAGMSEAGAWPLQPEYDEVTKKLADLRDKVAAERHNHAPATPDNQQVSSRVKESQEKNIASLPPEKLMAYLKKHGVTPASDFEKYRMFSDNFQMFGSHELDEEPVELKSQDDLDAYTYDQIIGVYRGFEKSPVDQAAARAYAEGVGASNVEEATNGISRTLQFTAPGRVGESGSYTQGDLFAGPGTGNAGQNAIAAGKSAAGALLPAKAGDKPKAGFASPDLIAGLKGDWEALAREIDAKGRASSIYADLVNNRIPDWDVTGTKIDSPEDVMAVVQPIRSPYFESLKVMVLDGNDNVVHSQILHVGSVNESIADPRRIFSALARIREQTGKNYNRIIISHNHPSGDPSPSSADRRLTSNLREICEATGWDIVDHVITNGETFFSFRNSMMIGGAKTPGKEYKPRKDTGTPAPKHQAYVNAPWEVVGRSELALMDDPKFIAHAAKFLRNGNPDSAHIFYLNTKMRLNSVERISLADFMDQTKRNRAILAGMAREGGYAFCVEMPGASPTMEQREVVKSLREFASMASMSFMDAIVSDQSGTVAMPYYSFRDAGLLEDPSAYGNRVNDEQTDFNFLPENKPAAQADAKLDPLDRFKTELPQAMRIAAQYDNIPGVDQAEVRQTARLALADAARQFDPSKGKPFSAYAGVAVRNRLRSLYRKEDIRRERFPVSLDEPVGQDSSGMPATRGDFAPDRRTPLAPDSASRDEAASMLESSISSLPEKMQIAVRGFNDRKTFEQIGQEMGGVSKQRAEQVFQEAMRRMRGKLGELGVSSTDQLMARSGFPMPEENRAAETSGAPSPGGQEAKITDFSNDPAWQDIAYASPSQESISRLKNWLKENPEAIVRMYHGTAAKHPIKEQGILPTSANRRNSLQSRSGFVSLSIYPGMAKTFAEMAYPQQDVTVYPVEVPVRMLVADVDQLKNKRMWSGYTGGNSLAESIAIGHGAQVKGSIPLWAIKSLPESPALYGGADELQSRSGGEDNFDDIDQLLRDLDSEIPGYQHAAEAEDVAGPPYGIGRPDLAHGADNADVRGADQYYTDNFSPESETQWQLEADKMLAKDYEGTKRTIENAGLTGQTITPAQTKAADKIATDLRNAMLKDGTPEARAAFNVFWIAYRGTGTAAGRALASRRDPLKTPAERYRDFLTDLILKPRPKAQKEIDNAKTPEEKARLIDAETKALLDKLKAAGINPDDILKDRVTLSLQNRNIIDEFAGLLARASGGDKDARQRAFRMILKNRAFADIAKATGLSETAVKQIKTDFIDKMRQQHFAKFKAGAKADSATLITGKQVDDATAERQFNKWLGNLGIVDDARQGRPKFNIEDPAHVMRMVRAIQAATRSNAVDMAYEWWIMNILSGPSTQFVNIAGNTVSAAWDMTVQRGMESLVNLAVRDSKSARLGEFQYLAKGLLPGMSAGLNMAARAWSAEHDFFEHTVLGTPLEINAFDKAGNVRSAIPGTAGRVIRVPGRALLFADSFFKMALGQAQVGAEAYRIAKSEGLSGKQLSDRIALLSQTRDQVISANLAKAKPDKEMVEFFAKALAKKDETLNADDLISDRSSQAWEMAREQTAFDMARKAGWTDTAWQRAVDKARQLAFQQDLKTSAEGGNMVEDAAAKLQDARSGNQLVGTFFPFVKTPYNIFRTAIRKSPLGAANLGVQVAKGLYGMKDGKPYLQGHPDAVRDISEQLLAWAALALLWGACQGDKDDEDKQVLFTGSMPFNLVHRGERELQQRAYGGDYVLRIGGRNGLYIHYGRYEPIATVLGTTVDMIRAIKSKGATADNMDSLYGYLMAQAQSKTFLQGFSDVSSAMQGTANIGDGAKRFLMQALVPNIIRQPLRNLDDYVRDTKHADALYQALPAANFAQPKVDIYGNDVKKGGNPIMRLFLTTPLKADEHLQNADRLLLNWNRENPSQSYAPQDPPDTYKKNGKEQKMTGDQYHRFTVASGRIASQILKSTISPARVQNPKKEDVDAIRKAFEDARTMTRNRMFP
jgi:RNA polymerase sigma factor (sigma-70 family)